MLRVKLSHQIRVPQHTTVNPQTSNPSKIVFVTLEEKLPSALVNFIGLLAYSRHFAITRIPN